MSHRFAIVSCLFAASVACSQQNEPVRDATDVNDSTASTEPSLTPASTEGAPRDSRAIAPDASTSNTPATTAPATNVPATDAPSTIGQPDAARPPVTAGTTDAAKGNPAQPPAGVAPDNTKVNERDRSSAAVTPTDQRENETDLKITQQIRKAVMADGTLSFTAKNVKIITAGGKVTLRGPVKTDAERNAIDAAARKVAGVSQVDNQIEVKK
jgi:hyperosmotically inducible periplasmic protein